MQQKGSRLGTLLVAIVLVLGTLGVVVAQSSGDSSRTRNAAIEAGLACKRLGQTQTVGAQRFTCGISKGAKVWFLVRTTQTALKPCASLGAVKTQKGVPFVCATVGKKKVWQAVVSPTSLVKENNANTTSGSTTTVPVNGNTAGTNPVVNVDVSKSEAPIATPIGVRMAVQPSGAVNGEPFAQAAVVQLRDEEGKDVPLAGVRVEAILFGAQRNVINTSLKNERATTDANGRATFTNLAITGQVGTYEILFIPSGLGAVISDFVELAPGAPVALEMAIQPWGARSGDVLMQQPLVQARDISGNAAATAQGKVVTAEVIGAGRMSSAGSASSVTADGDGAARFAGISISGTAGLYQLKFSAPGMKPVTSQSFGISSGDAAEVRVVTAASGAASGKAFTQQPVVETYDADGNLIREAGWVINATVSSGVATLTNTSATTDDAGRATFTALTASGNMGDFAIAYSVKNGRDIVAAVASEEISLTAGDAAKLMMVQQPVDMPSGGLMSVSPEVQVTDAWGNPTTSAVSVRVVLNGTKITREPWSRDFTPDQNGKVRLSTPSYSGKAQNLQLSFSAGETLTGVMSDVFALTPGVPTRLDVESVSAMPSGSFIAESRSAQRLTARLYDAAQNVVDNVPYPLHATVTQSNGAWINGYPHAESENGLVVFPAVKIYGVSGGTVTVVLTVGNLFDANPVTLSVSSDATVGDPGPSTGTIFFDKKTATAVSVSLTNQEFADLPFRYLEESPLDAEESKTFYRMTRGSTPPVTAKIFGAGNENSSKLQKKEIIFGNYVAARYANDLSVSSTNGAFDDWFLPSAQETQTLLEGLPDEHSGKIYWTSSLSGSSSAFTGKLSDTENVYLETSVAVSNTQLVRPIRAIAYTPSTPTNVTATATSVSTATLRFTQPPSPLSGAIRYAVTSTPAASMTTSTNNDGSIAVSGLAPATSYTFSLAAVAAYGRSVSSQSSAAIVTVPLPPTNLYAYSFGAGSFGIYCSSPSAGAGVDVTVEVASGLSGLTVQRTSACSFQVTGVPSASVYDIALVSRVGTVVSSAATIQHGIAPLAPINLVGSANSSGTLTFTFTAPPSNGAQIFYDFKQSGPTFISSWQRNWSSDVQRVTIFGLQRGGTYTLAVRASVFAQSRMVDSPYSTDLVVRVP
ncbi:MAG: fibronectin type III domain-containing protein [Actinobacteria bacterium]|nr:fibronectin type III domain-containing protein [Actinomycetota bacterium]